MAELQARPTDIQRAGLELPVVEAGGAIELFDDRGQLDTKAPLIRSSTRSERALRSPLPPRRRGLRNGLDDEHAGKRALVNFHPGLLSVISELRYSP